MEKFIVENLDCPHCAKEVEDAVAAVPGISCVSLNFIAKTLEFEAESEEALKMAVAAAKNAEDGIIIMRTDCGSSHCSISDTASEEHREFPFELLRIIASLVLFVTGFVVTAPYSVAAFLLSFTAVGAPVIFKAIKRGSVDEHFLMTVASCGAIITKNFAEGAAVMLFYSIGEYFQDKAVEKNRKSVSALYDIAPQYAVLEDGSRISPEDAHIGDIIMVKPGEKVPLDGIVTEGESELDTSALTGESIPVFVTADSDVLGGSINLSGALKIKVTHKYSENAVAKILDLVENASSKKAKSEKFITSFARVYTPAVVIAAILIAVIPTLIAGDFSTWLLRGLSFLVVSCPCALVISVPLTFFNSIGRCAKNGILIKGGDVIERIVKIKNIVFDKTGTLTEGKFTVSELHSTSSDEDTLLQTAAHAEAFSNHPIAKGILAAYGKAPDLTSVKDFKEIPGKGVSCTVDGNAVLAGNSAFLEENGIECEKSSSTCVHISHNGKYLGYITLEDKVKDSASVRALKELGKEVYMLTGDSTASAEKVASELGIENYHASLLPHDKVRITKEIGKQGAVMCVGDGINDAPMLALADVSVAAGGGSDIAIETADVVLVSDSPLKIAALFSLCEKCMLRVKQNISLSIGIKLLALLGAAFGITGMWTAVFADVGVAFIAIINAMRK